jgi:magnesium transporter
MEKMTWHHISKATQEDFSFLRETFQFHHLDYEDIQSESLISKFDIYKHYLFLTLHIPSLNAQNQILGIPLYLFLDETNIVTVTSCSLPVLDLFFASCQKSSKVRMYWMQKGSTFFLYKLLLLLFKGSLPLSAKLTGETNQMEQLVYRTQRSQTTIALARLRRNILFLRHLIDPQRHILLSLSHIDRSFFSKEYEIYFDDIQDLLETIWLTTDNLKSFVDGLFEVNEALISHRTNEIIHFFTLLSISLSGPIALTGFYGMNVSWLPFTKSPLIIILFFLSSFLFVFGLISSFLYLFQRRKKYGN